jgi:hypothetical protein
MPMEWSMLRTERGNMYDNIMGATQIRSYNVSHARPPIVHAASRVVKRAQSISSWTRPTPSSMERRGSIKSVAGSRGCGRMMSGLNLQSYSVSSVQWPYTGSPLRPTTAPTPSSRN